MAQSEFSIIKQYFEDSTDPRSDVKLGIGDDCALLSCPEGHVIAVSIDTLVEGVHFFPDVSPEALGYKSLAVSLSDLAAMGATPAWITLALTLPTHNAEWLKAFSTGLSSLAREFKVQLVGGDTTRGPLTISIQAHGIVKPALALTRKCAQVGDYIFVTGTLGDAGAALKYKFGELIEHNLPEQDLNFLINRLEKPSPRVMMGQALKGIASSAIDISDGLLADLGHILDQSGVGAQLDIDMLPLSDSLKKLPSKQAIDLALTAGDDYELCVTISKSMLEKLDTSVLVGLTEIGIITETQGIDLRSKHIQYTTTSKVGYDHFTN
jgi:thiamine-monophosphate kinase